MDTCIMGVNGDDGRILVMPVEETYSSSDASAPNRLMCACPIGAHCRPFPETNP